MQIADTPERERATTKAQLMRHSARCCQDFSFNQMMGVLDSPKAAFEMMMDAIRPFLGRYCQACCQPFNLLFAA